MVVTAPMAPGIYPTDQAGPNGHHQSNQSSYYQNGSTSNTRPKPDAADAVAASLATVAVKHRSLGGEMQDSIIVGDSMVKTEDDDSSESHASILNSLRTENEDRDSPNSSTTSTSLMTPANSLKHPSVPAMSANNTAISKHESPYSQPRAFVKFHAKSSIPSRIHPAEYARQSMLAAEATRLNPYALHPEEHQFLKDKLCHLHITVYLNIRNGICRLWIRNPNVSVSIEEAIGCAKDDRWTQLACFAYEWLVRRGYINFGCVDVPSSVINTTKNRRKEGDGPTIVVIGAGMAGLSCARQLNTIFKHYPDSAPPRVIILEGRNRVGGRIYSHPLSSMHSKTLEKHQRPTAEMGAHIIVGFEHGNPLDSIIRGQLALKYHSLRDLSTIYDIDGQPVQEQSDTMVERLYNDILDRTGDYRWESKIQKTAEGDKELMDAGRDPAYSDDGITISKFEEATAMGTIDRLLPTKSRRKGAGHTAPKADKPTEGATTSTASQIHLPAAQAATKIGFNVRKDQDEHATLELGQMAADDRQTLGATMDEGVRQYHEMLDFKPKALRLLNWHYANLEYANATNVEKLSLHGWDQDIGHEFEGEHSQVVGGYQQLPRALYRYPEKLEVRNNKAVAKIAYETSSAENGKAYITCEDGEVIKADKVVLTASLGVLKQETIQFEPPLPDWKQGAISRLGFGLLNKLVLVFDKPFWDADRDMFGLLREHERGTSGDSQHHYRAGRGRFYLFWNCLDTSGLPVLIALMAGDAAHAAESTPDHLLVQECMGQLRNVFRKKSVPDPLETIVTRWKSDRFARGSYSYVAAGSQPEDYDLMAKGIGNLFFAGEATCGTHPATVHGAYLSGLRACSEVVDSILGPIQVTDPIIPVATSATSSTAKAAAEAAAVPQKRKGDEVLPTGTFTRPTKDNPSGAQQAYEIAMWDYIYSSIGFAPAKPAKSGINPFLLYQKDHWAATKDKCDKNKQANSKAKNPEAVKASRDEVRIELGKMWRDLDDAVRQPYSDETRRNKEENEKQIKDWEVQARDWDRRTWEVKAEWEKKIGGFEAWKADWESGGKKLKPLMF